MHLTYTSGALLAMIASGCWTFAPFFFSSAIRSIGPYFANFWRLIMASVALWTITGILALVAPSLVKGVTPLSVVWMAFSGILGLSIGDFFYFKALSFLGPRRTLQILIGAPIFSAGIAWLWLNERLTMYAILGMTLTIGAIFIVNWFDKKDRITAEPGIFSGKGLLLAIIGTICQGAAAVLMRKAYMSADGLTTIIATAIRISSAGAAVVTLALVTGRISQAIKAIPSRHAFGRLMGGTALGPVAGMLFYVASLKFSPAGIASTMSSLSPILIIPISAWRYKTKLNIVALIAMAAAITGVVLIFHK